MGFVTGPAQAALRGGLLGLAAFRPCDRGQPLARARDPALRRRVVVAVTWGGANQVGTWTFLLLWWMHQSARLNVFLGVRNLNEEFLPDHLSFLRSFLNQRSR